MDIFAFISLNNWWGIKRNVWNISWFLFLFCFLLVAECGNGVLAFVDSVCGVCCYPFVWPPSHMHTGATQVSRYVRICVCVCVHIASIPVSLRVHVYNTHSIGSIEDYHCRKPLQPISFHVLGSCSEQTVCSPKECRGKILYELWDHMGKVPGWTHKKNK